MRVSQLVVWALVAIGIVTLWFLGPQDALGFKLMRSAAILIVGSMVASLCTVQRRK